MHGCPKANLNSNASQSQTKGCCPLKTSFMGLAYHPLKLPKLKCKQYCVVCIYIYIHMYILILMCVTKGTPNLWCSLWFPLKSNCKRIPSKHDTPIYIYIYIYMHMHVYMYVYIYICISPPIPDMHRTGQFGLGKPHDRISHPYCCLIFASAGNTSSTEGLFCRLPMVDSI